MNIKITKMIILQTAILLIAIPPSIAMDMEEVALRHKKSGALKLKCKKIKGKNDYYPTYKCFEGKNLKKFDIKDQWEEVATKEACFHEKTQDIIRPCLKIKGKNDKTESYGCFTKSGVLKMFTPDKANWTEINCNDPQCQKLHTGPKVPKGGDITVIYDPQRSEEDEPKK